jgi:transcriptional regulator with XRE-family HTH domain
MTLPEQLRVLRARRGLTLVEVAKETGIGRDTLSELERGHRRPIMPTIRKLADYYGVPVEELLGVQTAGPLDLAESHEIVFDQEAVREVLRLVRAGKLSKEAASKAVADLVKDGPLEDALELIFEEEANERAAERAANEARDEAVTAD